MERQNDIEIPGFRFDSHDWSRATSEDLFHRLPANLRQDAADPYFRARELEQIVESLLNEEYKDPKARELVPIESMDPGTDTIVVTGYGRTAGQARPRSDGALDLPLIDVSGGEMTAKPGENWLGCRYTDRELARAHKSGRAIDRDKMRAVQEDMEDLYDLQLRFGDPRMNTTGLLNSHTPTALTNGDWNDPTTTDAEILADFNNLVQAFRRQNPKGRLPNTVRWDGDTAARMSRAIDSAGLGGQSLLTVLQTTYPYIDFDVWDNLDTAGSGVNPLTGLGGVPLLIMYRKDRLVLRSWESRAPSPDPAERHYGVFTIPWMQWALQGVLWLRPLEGMLVQEHHT